MQNNRPRGVMLIVFKLLLVGAILLTTFSGMVGWEQSNTNKKVRELTFKQYESSLKFTQSTIKMYESLLLQNKITTKDTPVVFKERKIAIEKSLKSVQKIKNAYKEIDDFTKDNIIMKSILFLEENIKIVFFVFAFLMLFFTEYIYILQSRVSSQGRVQNPIG